MNFAGYYQKYKDVIPYAIFGVLTTLVNTAVYWICAYPLHLPMMMSTIFAWVGAVLFAYVTNRRWVFHSQAHTPNEIVNEMVAFFSCRLVTGFVDWGCMFLFVDLLGLNDLIIKFSANVLVIILNYVASKFYIFKSKEG